MSVNVHQWLYDWSMQTNFDEATMIRCPMSGCGARVGQPCNYQTIAKARRAHEHHGHPKIATLPVVHGGRLRKWQEFSELERAVARTLYQGGPDGRGAEGSAEPAAE